MISHYDTWKHRSTESLANSIKYTSVDFPYKLPAIQRFDFFVIQILKEAEAEEVEEEKEEDEEEEHILPCPMFEDHQNTQLSAKVHVRRICFIT